MMEQMVKKATEKDFLDGDTSIEDARKMAKAANAIVRILLPLAPKERQEAVEVALIYRGMSVKNGVTGA
jgi:hypothetical protein